MNELNHRLVIVARNRWRAGKFVVLKTAGGASMELDSAKSPVFLISRC